MKTLIIDTCFWIALYDPENNLDRQDEVEVIIDCVSGYQVLIPFPTLYEFLNSKFSRRGHSIQLKLELSKPNIIMIDDTAYKERALSKFFEKTQYKKREDVSLVDEIIKEMIDDVYLKTDFLITFDTALRNYALSRNVSSM